MKITENWSVDTKGEGCVLTLSENKTRKHGKAKGEEYVFTDNYYCRDVNHALELYLLKSLDDAVDLKNCMELIKQSMLKIESLSF